MGIDVEMFAVTKSKITKEQIADLSYHLSCAFGYDNFYIHKKDSISNYERRALEEVEVIGIMSFEDITEIFPEEDETFIRVSLKGAFYSIGYERGNFPLYKNVAEWLEVNIPDAVIHYGGDSVYPTLFDKETREFFWNHYCKVGNAPYYRMFQNRDELPMCDFCNHKMHPHYLSSRDFEERYICNGCGEIL